MRYINEGCLSAQFLLESIVSWVVPTFRIKRFEYNEKKNFNFIWWSPYVLKYISWKRVNFLFYLLCVLCEGNENYSREWEIFQEKVRKNFCVERGIFIRRNKICSMLHCIFVVPQRDICVTSNIKNYVSLVSHGFVDATHFHNVT